MNQNHYLPVPSLNYRYEINLKGSVRNAKTKKILKPYRRRGSGRVQPCMTTGKRVDRSVGSLLWEVHGIVPRRKFPEPKPVYIRKGGERYYFPSCNQCAKFLLKRIKASRSWIAQRLHDAQSEICGWQITYKGA